MVEIPGYRIEQELGAGGMATVFLAVQESLDRQVALKIMTPGLAVDESYCNRFLKEGRITAQLTHPNLLTVYDTGVYENHYYMASEFLPGGTARDKMREGLTDDQIIKIMSEVASGLGFAHSKGFVHRDVKPGNLLFRMNGDCVLGDFGIAKAVDSNTGATKIGTSIGTPHYMSPEQAKGEKVDHRTDIYSLGVLFFELLTGKPPFDADDPFSVALAQINEPVPPLPAEHARFQPLIEKLMEKDRDLRYARAEEFVEELKHLLGGGSVPAPAPAAPKPSAPPEARTEQVSSASEPSARSGSGFPLVKVAMALTIVVVLGAGSYLGWQQYKNRTDDPSPEPTPVAGGDPPGGTTQPENPYASQLAQARGHVDSGRLMEPRGRNALEAYQRILSLDPGNGEAQEGMKALAEKIEQAASVKWAAGELDEAKEMLETALRSFPGNAGLEYLLGQVESQLAAASSQGGGTTSDPTTPPADPAGGGNVDSGRLAELLRLGDKYYDANIFSHPPGENATDVYLEVLKVDPGNGRARNRLDEIAGTWASAAETNLRRGKLQIAQRMIDKGLQASPNHPKLLELQKQAEAGGG